MNPPRTIPNLPSPMAQSRVLATLLAVAVCGVGPLHAQKAESKPAPRPKITVIGASVSAGFIDGPLTGGSAENDSVALAAALKELWPEMKQPVVVRHRADQFMFQTPVASGENQMKRVLRDDPDVVCAVDFAFWFAYGYQKDGAARLERLEKCLAMLDQCKKPILLGDIPDMTGASTRLLRPAQIPSAKTRDLLNARLREWSKTRPHVTLLPLGAWLQELKTTGFAFAGEQGTPLKAPAGSLLQGDRLHVTRLGVALLATRLAGVLQRKLPDSPFATPHASAAEVSRAIDAEFEYEDLVEDIAAQPKPEAKGSSGPEDKSPPRADPVKSGTGSGL